MQIVDRLNDNWVFATEIHKLEARLWRRVQKEGDRVILFTSAGRGDGKSTTVAFLSAALSLHPERRIIAVDLDFREPTLNTYFQVEIAHSFGEALRGTCRLEDAIIKTGIGELDLICPDGKGDDPSLLLKTEELYHAFAYFRAHYDLTIMDVPAMLPVADTSLLLPLADGVVLLAMAGKTTRHELTKAREICLGMDSKILGMVVGNLDEAVPEYRQYGYGYGYGYAQRKPARIESGVGNGRQ